MNPRSRRPPTDPRPSANVLRAVLACALAGMIVAALRAEWRQLPDVLEARAGLHVVPGSVHWLEPRGVFAARRALFLARRDDGPADVYVVTARTGPGDRIISLRNVSNLTRSRDADETGLVVAPPFAAFASRVGGTVVAVTLLDARGEPRLEGADTGARFRSAVTRLQQTGSPRGYGMDRFDLVHPAARVSLALDAHALEVRPEAQSPVRVALAPRAVLAGAERVRARPREVAAAGAWVTWAVDTVRAVPWIGPAPIAWAETIAFRAEHAVAQARVATMGDHSQREVAEDLADLLATQSRAGASALEGPVAGWPPAAIAPIVRPGLAHEGEWTPIAGANDPFVRTVAGAPPPMYVAFLRSDRERPDTRTYITVWDPAQVELHVTPGSEEPMGATGETGTGAIPRDEPTMTRLIGAFNGAFQALHGEYGVYAEGTVLLPAKPYAATVALLADGAPGFGTWPNGRREIPDEVLEFRQNLTALVDNGAYNPWRRNFWGGVVAGTLATEDQHTARSGLCLTREGHVAYFWGPALTPQALGDAMLATRCEYGMHLDMNGQNTGFELYRVDAPARQPAVGRPLEGGYEAEGTISGLPGVTFRARKLVRRMSEPLPRYIRRDPRDFFYLLLRTNLPGPPLVPPVAPAQPGEGEWHVAGTGETAFPWPMARTRVRPDPARPDRWVNLVRVDARRVALAPADTTEGAVVARFVNGALAQGSELRLGMTQGAAGRRWSIGITGDGLAGEALGANTSALRGAGIDANGFLVIAVADRAGVPGLVSRALDLAGCGPARLALGNTTLALPSGVGVAGGSALGNAPPVLALLAQPALRGRRIFPEVTPVSPNVWAPVQRRQVRYTINHEQRGTVQVHLAGQQPLVIPMRGLPTGRVGADAGTPARAP